MHCPATGPGRFLLVHPYQSHPSPRTSSQLVAATETENNNQDEYPSHRSRNVTQSRKLDIKSACLLL